MNGTQYLTAGTYAFICSIHPTTMQATLDVTGNGTALPRPTLSMKLSKAKLATVAKNGRLQVAVNASAKSDNVAITAKLGKTTLAQAPDLSLAAGQQFEILKIGKKGRAKLASKSKATVTLTGSIPFGPPATAKGKLK